MKLELVDRFGNETVLYVRDLKDPVLTDEKGRAVIDFQGLFPQPPTPNRQSDPNCKWIIDPFIQRPTGGLSDFWVKKPGTPLYDQFFGYWREALLVMTGKMLIRASK